MPEGLVLDGLVVEAAGRRLVDGVSLEVRPGRVTALVGPSGSGKTLTVRACLGLVRARPGVVAGRLRVEVAGAVVEPYAAPTGRERERRFRALRGTVLGYLPQQAAASLDPLWSVGRQVREVLRLAELDASPAEVRRALERAGLDRPGRVARLYPFQLSGGMAQRVCIALALGRGSRILLADEPTTGLDPTVQRAILREIRRLADEGLGVLFVTHDLRIVPAVADDVLVMSGGRVVDRVPAGALDAVASAAGRALLEATARVAGGCS